jgi:hypothetical protein
VTAVKADAPFCQQSEGVSLVNCQTTGGFNVTIIGETFNLREELKRLPLEDTIETLSVFIGGQAAGCDEQGGVACAILSATNISLLCKVQNSSNGGSNLPVEVKATSALLGDRSGTSSDNVTVSFARPRIDGLFGCRPGPNSNNLTLVDCSTDEEKITITGSNFGFGIPLVLVGSGECAHNDDDLIEKFIPHKQIVCRLPQGGYGEQASVRVYSDKFSGEAASVYFEPCRPGEEPDKDNQTKSCKACDSGTFSPGGLKCAPCGPGEVTAVDGLRCQRTLHQRTALCLLVMCVY